MQRSDALNQKFPANLEWNTRFKRYTFAPALPASLREIFADAEDLLQQARIIKNSRSTSAGIFSLNGTEYFIKRSNADSWSSRLRRIGRMSRVKRNLLVSSKITSLGIRVPAIYAAVETRPWGLPGAGYLITESFPRPMTASGVLESMWEECDHNWDRLAQKLIAPAVKMHDHGVEHGDFKLNNILAYCNGDAVWQLGVFDFDGSVLHSSSCSDLVRIRELARMVSSTYIRCSDLNMDCNWSFMLECWAKAYAEISGKDFSENDEYRRRAAKFLPGALKYRIEQK